jgi:hypothetical protein
MKFLSFIFSLIIATALFAPAAFASEYSVSPLVIDHELEKRDIVHETITITNPTSRVIRIYPTVNEVSVDEGGAIKSFVEPSMTADRTTSITSWIEITRARIELKPGESKEIPLTIKVNPEVGAGEYHAFIGFPEGSNRDEAQKKVNAGTAPGTVVRIGVDKVQNQFLRLTRFVVERFIKGSSEGSILYSLANPGSDPVKPGGEIIFYDTRGTEVASVPVNASGTVIEGGKDAVFTGTVPTDLKMGKYKAFLSVEYGDDQVASVNDTTFFYVLPLKTIIIAFALVLLLAIALALYVHRKYDLGGEEDGSDSVALFLREGRSESKDHDIDLSQKNPQ